MQQALSSTALYAMLSRGETRDAYRESGYSWGNLPGTLSEAQGVSRLLGGDLVVSEKVTEAAIKELSVTGRLKEYRVLHFATHGIVDPVIPELSAVVLSQAPKLNTTEDGYLQAREIVELNLAADFVNLSACETGLGRIVNGEGIVGLTQSFLLAGANGISVSLWKVDDTATMEFMLEVYKRVKNEGMSYADALTATKRSFIAGKYASPCYWAPFVYYGE